MKGKRAVSVILILAMCLSFMTAFAENVDYTNTDYYETVVETIDYSDLATDSKFYATETNGNVFYKVNATTGYLHQGDQYASNMFEKPLVNGGEYMIEYKAYTYGISHTARSASYGTYLKHNDSGSDYPMVGFKLQVNYGTNDYKQVLVTPNFHFRYGKRSSGETLVDTPVGEAFYLNAATWYTYRYIYNLDTKKATLQIYDAAGTTLVKELSYDMPTTVPGKDKTISYDNMKWYYLNADAKIIWVGIDDFKIIRTAAKPAVVNYDPAKVSVSYEGKEVKNGETFPIPYNSTTPAKFTVTPKGDNEVSKVLVNGKEITGTTSFEVTSVKGDTTIDILVKGAPEVKSVTVTGTPQVTDVLTATAVITDGDGDKVSAEYQWEFLDGAEWKPIKGATDKEYEITESVLGKQLRVTVTPYSDNEPKEGTPFSSQPTEAVTPYKEPAETDFIQSTLTYEDQDGVALEEAVKATGQYVVDDGVNKYWLATATPSERMKAFYLIPDNKTMGKEGEYTVSYKQRYNTVGATANVYSTQASLYYTKSTGANPNCFMGFGFAPVKVVGTDTVKTDILFHYRWREPGASSDTETSVTVSDEPWVFNPDAWYTYKHVYNLDSTPKTAKLYIYDSTGKEVKTVTYELPNAIPNSPSGFNPKYDELSFTYVRANVSYNGQIGIDDLAITKTVRKPVTLSYNDAKVSVSYDKKKIANGGRAMVPYNSTTPAVFTITTKDGAVIDKILFNGASIGTTAELTSVTEAGELKILVEEAPVIESLSVDGVVQVGETLTANAKATDINDDNVSINYQWQSKEADGWKDITNATAKTYEIPEAMLGKQLRVIVTPVSDVEPKAGASEESAETTAVVPKTVAPSAKNLKVAGSFDVSNKLVVSYEYVKSESDIKEGNSDVIFETADAESGPYTSVQTSAKKEYIIKNSDAGKWMRIRVIPKDFYGVAGAEMVIEPVQISTKLTFFVSTEGDDTNDGSIEKPFATISKAQETIRAMKGVLPKGGVVVNIMGGTYPTKDTLKFDAVDSGTKESPIVYQAYNGEKVVLTGGKVLDTSKIQKVTDPKLLNGLVEEHAKDHLYMLDLKAQGVEMHELKPYGRGYSGYSPKMLTMNNTVLTEARWPNDDQSQMLVKCRPLTKKDGIDENLINANNTPIMFEYPDPENRSAKWNIKKGDAYVGGAIVYFWAQVNLLIDNIDVEKKVVTSLNASTYGSVKDVGWGPQHKVYFSNIFAEIDQPGEYYVDREKGIMYFYPIGDVEHAEMSVSDSGATMLLADDMKYVTFKGLTMKDTSGALLYFRNCEYINVLDNELCNAGNGISMTKNIKNSVVSGNHIYNINGSAISLNEGNIKDLEAQNNLIENNNLHTFSLLRTTPYGIYVTQAVGNTIRYNEINDFCQGAILLENTVDTTIEYNKIINGAQSATDMGAIYWGRNAISLGNVVRYNYFENIGSEQITHVLEGGHTYGLFNDDGTTGGYVYGNVFFDGGTDAAITGNGSEFGTYENNVFISTNTNRFTTAFRLNTWGNRPEGYEYKYNGQTINMKDKIPARVWLYLMDLRTPLVEPNGNTNLWNGRKDMAWSDTWINHYKGTQWERTLDYYSKKNYDAVKALADAGDRDGMLKYLDDNLPDEWTNTANNNLIFNGLLVTPGCGGHEDVNNYKSENKTMSAAEKAWFVDYEGKNFALTDAGLAEARKYAPEFTNIPFDEIGLKTNVGGSKPVVTVDPAIVKGTPALGQEIEASYTFTDADGDEESTTKIYWYVSDKANGEFEKIQGVQGKYFTITDEYKGKYLKYEIIPYDTHALRGETVLSKAFAITTADNALLSDLKVNGETIKNFRQDKFNYMVSLAEMPEITVETAAEGATVEITKSSDSLPTKFIITVTALDGKTTQTYQVSVTSTGTTPPTVSPTVSPTIKPTIKPPTTGFGGGGGGIAGVIGSQDKEEEQVKKVFTDTIGHWAEADINEMADKGIVSGVSDTTFEPDRSITRAEFAALMTRALKLTAANDDAVFTDVSSDSWYKDAVSAAAAAGLIVGYDGAFRPNDTITREEMAVVIMKAYQFLGNAPLKGKLSQFADKDVISAWAVDYVDGAVSSGLISGMDDGTFAPKANATRAQVASLIKRLLNK